MSHHALPQQQWLVGKPFHLDHGTRAAARTAKKTDHTLTNAGRGPDTGANRMTRVGPLAQAVAPRRVGTMLSCVNEMMEKSRCFFVFVNNAVPIVEKLHFLNNGNYIVFFHRY